jgi:hypothetical protein
VERQHLAQHFGAVTELGQRRLVDLLALFLSLIRQLVLIIL